MPASAGFNRVDGAPLTGWRHVEQSIAVILTTPIGTRLMRRDFGSEIMDLIDRPLTEHVVLAIYAATANALARWEPRYRLTRAELVKVNASGEMRLALSGIYYPRGHLGDFTPAKDSGSTTVSFGSFR